MFFKTKKIRDKKIKKKKVKVFCHRVVMIFSFSIIVFFSPKLSVIITYIDLTCSDFKRSVKNFSIQTLNAGDVNEVKTASRTLRSREI